MADAVPNQEQEPQPSQEAQEESRPLTFGQRLTAAAEAMRGHGATAEIEALKAELSALKLEKAGYLAEIGLLNGKLDAANARLVEADQAVTDFEAKLTARTIERIAEAHVPPGQLPAAANEGGEDREAALRERLKTEQDPKERGRICQELSAIRNWKN